MMANDGGTEGVKIKITASGRVKKPRIIRIAAGTSITIAIIAANVGSGAPEEAIYCTVPLKPHQFGIAKYNKQQYDGNTGDQQQNGTGRAKVEIA